VVKTAVKTVVFGVEVSDALENELYHFLKVQKLKALKVENPVQAWELSKL
jgi:hypothetical protein